MNESHKSQAIAITMLIGGADEALVVRKAGNVQPNRTVRIQIQGKPFVAVSLDPIVQTETVAVC